MPETIKITIMQMVNVNIFNENISLETFDITVIQ